MGLKVLLLHCRDEPGRTAKQGVHLLEWALRSLRHKGPEEDSIGKVAYNKQQKVAPVDAVDSWASNLSDHRVEGERDHRAQGDTLGSGLGVEDLCGNYPRQRAARERERDLVHPIRRDKSPTQGMLTRGRRVWKRGDCGGDDDETEAINQIANDQGPSAAKSVDEENRAKNCQSRQNVANALVLQRFLRRDLQGGVNLRREVLNC